MATITAVFLYGIPDDKDTDVVRILESSTEAGTYTTVSSEAYVYGQKATEYDAADSTKWYKIQFYSSTTNVAGPISDPVYGGDYDKSKPFFAISTSFDGAGYATVAELMEQSKLGPQDVSSANCAKALKVSRAYLDLIMDSQGVNKYSRHFVMDDARRKYNAQLELIKQVEIKFALSMLYKDLADDKVMNVIRDPKTKFDSVSIGQTSLSQTESNELKFAEFLDTQSQRYNSQATALLQTLLPTSIPVSYGEVQTRMTPLEWTAFAGSYISKSAESLELITITLTGNGVAMNGAEYTFTGTGSKEPVSTTAAVSDAVFTVNGVVYPIESYVSSTGVTIPLGIANTGFVLSLSAGSKIQWNFTTANGGFDLTNSDEIVLKYWA